MRALYDFEPTEAGELGFQKDDIIEVLATSYQDWWKGELYGRQGIFPVNYVEEIKEGESNQNAGDLDDEANVLHEAKNVDGLIQMLQNIDPRRDNFSDNETLQDTYNNVLGVRPKLVELIRKHGEKKDEMMLLNEKLARARATYEKMMEQSIAKYSNPAYTAYQPHPSYQTAAATPNYFTPQPGQPGQNGQPFSTAPYQPQYSSAPIQAQAPYQPEAQYAPYTPQLQQQQPLSQQQAPPQQTPQQMPQQQLTFDQVYTQPAQPVGQVDYHAGAPPQQFSQPPPQQQQPVQQFQGQPMPQQIDYSGQMNQQQQQHQQQPGYAPQPAAFAPPTNGYAPAAVPSYQ